MDILFVKLEDLNPYENNPRNNENAVQYVKNSIREFGFKVPLVIDRNYVIVCGHTRYKAAKEIGLKEVPCIIADNLTEDQIKAFRLADNKTQELAEWDWNKIGIELDSITGIDMSLMGFEDFIDQFDLVTYDFVGVMFPIYGAADEIEFVQLRQEFLEAVRMDSEAPGPVFPDSFLFCDCPCFFELLVTKQSHPDFAHVTRILRHRVAGELLNILP